MRARTLCFMLIAALSGCAEKPAAPKLTLTPASYTDLKDWSVDRQSEALVAFNKSCAVINNKPSSASMGIAGRAQDWHAPCRALNGMFAARDDEARKFFETWFRPYAVNDRAKGLFTGYYEAELNGAWQRGGAFQTPLWQRPNDLVTVDLGDFKAELKGQKITGKVENHKLKPYDDRAAIAQGLLGNGRAQPLVWVDDPVGAFFLEIQGSGRIHMTDGSVVRVGYETQNGHPYTAIGKVLADEGMIERPVTMAKIRAWLKEHPDQAQTVMFKNASAVFFRRLDGEGPVGAQGVVLTPERSLAVDPSFVPLGAPMWLEPEQDGIAPSPRLVVAQDTGGAIKGPVRGDFFWGAGAKAEERAGAMQSRGIYYLLLPKTVNPDER